MSSTTGSTLGPAAPADASAIASLLRAAALPAEDFIPHLDHFFVARRGDEILGAIGAELCGDTALLRSLVVAPSARGAGLGGRLLAALDRAGGPWGVRDWWLLTTTAENFFIHQGFRVATRSEAPAAIRQTGQFLGGCCASATCLTRPRKTSV